MLKLLGVETIPFSQMPSTILWSDDWKHWQAAGFIGLERHGTNQIYRIIDREALREIFYQKFPDEAINDGSAIDNVRAFRDSKARTRISQGIFFLRGWQPVIVNGYSIDLDIMTERFGLFATVLNSLHADKVCLVENLDCFRQAEKVLGSDWMFLHTYGRVGKEWLKKIVCREILVFSDYDFVGLDEFLRVIDIFPNAQFHLPAQYEMLSARYARPLKKRDEGEQLSTRRVSKSCHPAVVAIREQLFRTGKFLEQQALFI